MSTKWSNRRRLSLLYTFEGEVGSETELVSASLGDDTLIRGTSVSLDGCVLNRTTIRDAEGLSVRGCKLVTADAAGANLERSSWRESQIDDSRFTGAKMNEAYLDVVAFRACKMNLMQCQSSELRRTRFDQCDLRDAYFNGSILSGTSFEGSDLTGADFSGAVLKQCDFRRAVIENIRVAPEQLNGVIVTSDQALYLARLFGLDIRE